MRWSPATGEGGPRARRLALARRSRALAAWARPRGFELAIGHGSVDLAVVSTLLRIPSAQMQDYEFAGLQRQLAFRAARRVLVPEAISVAAMRRAGAAERKLFRYPGLKEDYYLADFEPDPAVLAELGVARRGAGARGRPPAARDFGLSPAKLDLRRGASTGSPAERASSPW